MADTQTLTDAPGSSPAAPESPQGIDPSARTQFAKPSFTEHLNRRPQSDAGADASQASGGVDSTGAVTASRDVEGASADPSAFDPRTAPQEAAQGEPATGGDASAADPYASTDNLPWNKDPRFQQFLADRKALQEQQAALAAPPPAPPAPAPPAADDPFAPLAQQLRDAGFNSYAEFEQYQREQAQQAEDAAYEASLRAQAEDAYYDEDTTERIVATEMRALRAERAAEEAKRHYEATLTQQAEQQRMRAYTNALTQFPVLRSFAANSAGEGIGQRTLVELARAGSYSPEQITQAAASLAADYQTAIDAAVAAAKTEAAQALKKSASAPATTGTRGQGGGTAPGTGMDGALNAPAGVGFPNILGKFTSHLNRRGV